MSKEEKMHCKVTDTKQKILKAYREHLDQINDRASQTVSTIAEKTKKDMSKAITTAKQVKPQDIETEALELQKGVIAQIREVVDGLAERKAKFDELDEAIKAKNQELKEVFEIEREANALSALLKAQEVSEEEAQEEIAAMLRDAREEAETIVSDAERRAKDLESDIAKMKEETEKTRAREKEEYEYSFIRLKAKRMDSLQDKLDEMSKSLDEREETVAKRELAMKELESIVGKLSDELTVTKASIDDQIKAAKEAATKSAERGAAIAANIAKSKHESELNIRDHQINSLKESVSDLKSEVARLQEDLNQANSKVQAVAMQALQSNAEASRPVVIQGDSTDGKRK